MITPDVLRNAVVDADREITDFRIVQTAADTIRVELDSALPRDSDARVIASLDALFDRRRRRRAGGRCHARAEPRL